MILEPAFAVLYFLGMAISLWCTLEIKEFLKVTPCIDDEQSLDQFKNIARRNMYAALAIIVIYGTGAIVGVLLIFRYGLSGLIGVILTNAVVFGSGMYLSRLEKKSRSLPCATEDLAQQHQEISEKWVKKPFPDF